MKASKASFTIIEVLVASAVMAVIVTIILSVTSGMLTSWNLSSGRLATNFESRIALDFLAKDLEGALFGEDTQVWLKAKTDSEYLPWAAPAAEGIWLSFFTSAQDRDRGIDGDITVVNYRLLHKNPVNPSNTDRETYGLYRTVIDSDDTFNNYLGQLGSMEFPRDFLDPDVSDAVTQAFLASNILTFHVTFWIRDPSDPSGFSDLDISTGLEFPHKDSSGNIIASHPEFADISITVLNDEGAKLMMAKEEGLVTDSEITPKEVIARYGTVFTQRVHFMNNPL